MKRVLFMVIALVLVCSVSAFAAFNVKVGMDFAGEYTVEDGDGLDVDSGFIIAGEYLVPYQDNMELGIGLAYQTERSFKDGLEDAFSFIPLYGLARYQIDNIYLVGELGYNIFNISDTYKNNIKTLIDLFNPGADVKIGTEGGLFYGAGVGTYFTERLTGEILYSVSNGVVTIDSDLYESEEEDVKTSQISLMLGYKF